MSQQAARPKQLVFIDESGDTGFKTSKGSSDYFVIALVIFDDYLDAEETALTIKKHRRSLDKSDRYEFKFTKSSHQYRMKFLKKVCACDFKVRAIVVEKEVIYSPQLRRHKESFYNYFLRKVLERNNNTISNAKIRIDGSGERAFRKEMQTYLRKNLNSQTRKVMNNLRFRDSQKDVLIQLADMIAGAIRKSYAATSKKDKQYLKTIENNIDDIWEFK